MSKEEKKNLEEQEIKAPEEGQPAEEAEEKAPEAEETEEKSAEEANDAPADEAKPAPKEETPKQASAEELQAQYLRLAADFQNFRKRTEKEKADIYAFANEKLAVELLGVIDNFERAMDAAPADDKFAEGMGLILKQLQDILKSNHVEEIEAQGKEFDPNFHNAVMTEAAREGVQSNTVTKVFQKGYVLNSKVIRPAMVCVAQ